MMKNHFAYHGLFSRAVTTDHTFISAYNERYCNNIIRFTLFVLVIAVNYICNFFFLLRKAVPYPNKGPVAPIMHYSLLEDLVLQQNECSLSKPASKARLNNAVEVIL